jgi:hypothetical protein
MLVDYNEAGNIVELKVNYEDLPENTIDYLVTHIPCRFKHIDHYKTLKNVRVTEIPFDTSFNTFWNSYGSKMGNKGRSERLWAALNETERTKAIKYIQTYNNWLLQNTGVSKKLPETYLNQQPWNN